MIVRRLSRVLLMAAALLLPMMVGACAGRGGTLADSNLSDIELTWMRAMVALPPGVEGGDVSLRRMADVLANPPRVNQPLPTVVYLHGCTGLGDLTILKALAQAGYAVIAPDSMARRYRPLQCDPATGRGGFNLFVYDFRQTELAFAIHNIPKLPWADGTNLFLLGGSEGGVAAALYRGDAFRGRIITAWTCHGAPIVAGLASPPMEPVLSIVSVDDPWYADGAAVGQTGDCGAYMAGRPNARSVVLPAGEGHAVQSSGIARQAILEFLATWSRN